MRLIDKSLGDNQPCTADFETTRTSETSKHTLLILRHCIALNAEQQNLVPVAVAGVWIRVSWRSIFALGPRRALACAAVSICSTLPTCMTTKIVKTWA